MQIETEIELHVVLVAHRQPVGDPQLYEYVGLAQSWTDAVILANEAVGMSASTLASRWTWHGSDEGRYAVLPNEDGNKAIHVKKVKL